LLTRLAVVGVRPQPEVIRTSLKSAQPEPAQSYYRSKPLHVPKHPGANKTNSAALTGRLLHARERRAGMPDASAFATPLHSASRPASSLTTGRPGTSGRPNTSASTGPIPFPLPPGSGRYRAAAPEEDIASLDDWGFALPQEPSHAHTRRTPAAPPSTHGDRPMSGVGAAPRVTGTNKPQARASGAKDPDFYRAYTFPLEEAERCVASGQLLRTFDVQALDGAMGHRSEMFARKQESLYQFDPSQLTMCERIGAKFSLSAHGLSARTLQLPVAQRPPPPPRVAHLADAQLPETSGYTLPVELEGVVEPDAVMSRVMEHVATLVAYLPMESFQFDDAHAPEQWVELGRVVRPAPPAQNAACFSSYSRQSVALAPFCTLLGAIS
jgi:hypothetical protein